MSLGPVLDVVIGLVFVYFLLALIASGVQEVIAGIFQWRGTYLSKGIDVILNDSPDAAFSWAGVRDFLVGHFTWKVPATPASPNPAFPPAGATQAAEAALARQRVLAVQSHPLVRGSPTGLPSYVSSRNFALALLEVLRDGSQLPLFSQAERTIAMLPEGDLKRTLSLFLQNAGGDLDAFRASVETWFDDAMDRLSGIYARISQYMLIVLGLVLALSMNVDSIRVTRTLWQDSYLRGQVATAASAAAAQPMPGGQADASLQGSNGDVTPTPSPRDVLQTLKNLELPLGWSDDTRPRGTGVVAAIFGWLLTAAAVALGAPFWFSLLQQFTNFRSAGPKPGPSTASTSARGVAS